jgi:glycerol-3-phosphate dehydrogenase
LPGGDLPRGDRAAWLADLAKRYPKLPPPLLRALAQRHGTRASMVLDQAQTLDELGPSFGAELTAREIDYFVKEEWAMHADDVLWRRTKCGLPMNDAQRAAVGDYLEGRR